MYRQLPLAWMQSCMWSVFWNIIATVFLALISFFSCSSFRLSYPLLTLNFFFLKVCIYRVEFSASDFYFFLSESCGWGCFSPSEGSLSPSFRCNTEFKCTQSNPFYLLKIILEFFMTRDFLTPSFNSNLRIEPSLPPLFPSRLCPHLFHQTGGAWAPGIFFIQRTPLLLAGNSSLPKVDYLLLCSVFWLFYWYLCMIAENRKWTGLLW